MSKAAKKPTPTLDVRDKIKPLDDLAEISELSKKNGHSVVLAHGAFDLIHLGHVRHLMKAREEGDILMVTVTDDPYVNKGPGRPVFTAILRAEMLAALGYVDWVGINKAPGADDAIEKIRPSVYVKGSDYATAETDVTGKIVAERQAVEKHGGRIAFTDDITFSSSELINRHLHVHSEDLQGYLSACRGSDLLDRALEGRV